MKMEFESFDEIKKFLDDLGYEIHPKTDEAKKQKKAEYDKQRYQEKKNSTVKNSEKQVEEKREEKEEVSPLSPLPLSPAPLFPIPPISPLPEEREESAQGEIAVRNRDEKQAYGSCKNVMLSDREYDELERKLGFVKAQDLIEDLSLYMGQSRKNAGKYTNHYLTLLNWDRREQKRQATKPQPKRESWTEIAERISEEMNHDDSEKYRLDA